jgi:uncharacterized metal-binding protein YceD (DUF177 family)
MRLDISHALKAPGVSFGFSIAENLEPMYAGGENLKEVRAGMAVPFSEEFAREEDDDHPDRYLFRGESLDLTQMAGDLVSLNVPMRHLCGDGCKGLCPVCGADRNSTDCGHAGEGSGK